MRLCPGRGSPPRGSIWIAAAGLVLGCRDPSRDVVVDPGTGLADARIGERAAAAVEVWPALPTDPAAAVALVRRHTRRPVRKDEVVPLARAVDEALAGERPWVAGWRRIVDHISARLAATRQARRDGFLLFGSYHDAPGQMVAFGRLVSPGGVAGWTHVVVEQFDADGRWRGVDPAIQRGDDALIERFLAGGDRTAFATLRERQLRLNYTAWKYGYVDEVLQLLTAARAADTRMVGCDMPRAVQRRLHALASDLRDRLREIHCLLHLDQQELPPGVPRQVAMVWGQAHALPAGLPRLLTPATDVLVVLAYGDRRGADTVEDRLGRGGLTLLAPVLIEACAERSSACDRLVLLLPGRELGGELDRARDPIDRPVVGAGHCRVVVRSTRDGWLRLGEHQLRVGRRRQTVAVRASADMNMVLRSGPRSWFGSVELPDRGEVTFDLDPPRGRLRVVQRAAR